MKLSDKQKAQVNAMFTGKQYDKVITAMQKQRGPQTYFDSDGSLIMSKPEIEARIQRTAKRNIWMAKRERKEKAGRAISSMDVTDLKLLRDKIDNLIVTKNKKTVKRLKAKVHVLNQKISDLEK